MKKEIILEKTIEFVKEQLSNAESGHDWWHVQRVWNSAKNISKDYKNVDHIVIELACLLHDVADEKFDDAPSKNKTLIEFISKLEIADNQKDHVIEIINSLSFRKSFSNISEKTIEFQIVQDADRLDAIGAIGIARAFSYGGHKNREMHNPDIKPENFTNSEQYQKSKSPTINHFYEKLFLLKELMNTPEAQKIADERDEYMKDFVARFYKEWEGIL